MPNGVNEEAGFEETAVEREAETSPMVLYELLQPSDERKDKYRALVKKIEGRGSGSFSVHDARFSETWRQMVGESREAKNHLQSLLEGRCVVDLGGGRLWGGRKN